MALPARAYDALYDTTYSVSGARDHYRQQTVAGGFMLERAPDFPNMFSELPHHPGTTYRLKNSDKVPAFVDRAFHPEEPNPADLTMRSRASLVAGQERYKYFRRPLLAAPTMIVKQASVPVLPPPPPPVPEPLSKTVGTQSDYRESEAQTTPWEPDAVLPQDPTLRQRYLSQRHNCEGPELLQLKDLKFGDGLPPGLQEVRRVEKMREKRAFEATLPPISDLEQLPVRQKMIEQWEAREWAEREEEILSVQDERLQLLEHALQVREEEFDESTLRRVEQRKADMLREKATKFAEVQASRIKTMRQLIEARKYVEKPRKLHKLGIVERYAGFGSSVYAPVTREGRFPEARPQGRPIETEGFQPASLQGIAELETSLPARLLNPQVSAPQKPAKLDYKQRQDAAIQRDLTTISGLLESAKATKGRGFGDCWPAPLKEKDERETSRAARSKAAARAADRPDTPVLPVAATPASGRDAAAVLLQRLLRGRAAQNIMYEGRMRRLDLIQELRLEGTEQASTSRPEDRDRATLRLDALLGSVLSELMYALATPDVYQRSELLQKAFAPPAQEPVLDLGALPTPPPRTPVSKPVTPPLPPASPAPGAAAARGASAHAHHGHVDPKGIAPREPNLESLGVSVEEAEKAVVKIQAAFKGHQARKEVAAKRQRGAELKAELAAAAAAPEVAARKAAAAAAAAARAEQQQEYSQEEMDRIVMIQSLQRGRIARKRVQAIKSGAPGAAPSASAAAPDADPAAAGSSDGAAGGLEITPDLEDKVVKIQALQRGRKARQEVAAMRAAQQQQAAAQEPQQPMLVDGVEVTPELEQKVIKIQALQRGRKARQEVQAMRVAQQQPQQPVLVDGVEITPDLEQKVIKIQALQRGRKARQEVAAMRATQQQQGQQQQEGAAAPLLVDGVEVTPDLEEKVIKIQALQRGRKARQEVQAMRAAQQQQGEGSAAPSAEGAAQQPMLIDGVEVTPDIEQKVVKLQALQRGRKARQEVAAMRATHKQQLAQNAQTGAAQAGASASSIELTPELEQQVVKIQALQRGRKARQEVAAMRAAQQQGQGQQQMEELAGEASMGDLAIAGEVAAEPSLGHGLLADGGEGTPAPAPLPEEDSGADVTLAPA